MLFPVQIKSPLWAFCSGPFVRDREHAPLIPEIPYGFGLPRNYDLLGVVDALVVNPTWIAVAYGLDLPGFVYGDLMFDRMLFLLARIVLPARLFGTGALDWLLGRVEE